MFGYVSCDEVKLTPSERDLVGSFYCGLCMALKSTFGNFARVFTNMDCTYAFMFIVTTLDAEPNVEKKKCILHPFSKRRIVYVNDEITKKIASATVLISYYKILDDCKDEKKSATRKMLKSFYKKTAKKAMQILPNFKNDLEKYLIETQNCERTAEEGALCQLMDISGKILASMAENCGVDALKELFFELGRFIYLMDAIDDYDSDKREKRYNAVRAHFGDFSTKGEMLNNKYDELNALYKGVKEKLSATYNKLIIDEVGFMSDYNKYYEVENIFENLFEYGLDKTFLNVQKTK